MRCPSPGTWGRGAENLWNRPAGSHDSGHLDAGDGRTGDLTTGEGICADDTGHDDLGAWVHRDGRESHQAWGVRLHRKAVVAGKRHAPCQTCVGAVPIGARESVAADQGAAKVRVGRAVSGHAAVTRTHRNGGPHEQSGVDRGREWNGEGVGGSSHSYAQHQSRTIRSWPSIARPFPRH